MDVTNANNALLRFQTGGGAASFGGTISVTGTSTMAAINASGSLSVTGALVTIAPTASNPTLFINDPTKGSAMIQGGVNTGATALGDYWVFNVPTSRGLSWSVNNVSVLNALAAGVTIPGTLSVTGGLIRSTYDYGTGAPATAFQITASSGVANHRASLQLTDALTASAYLSYLPSATPSSDVFSINLQGADRVTINGAGVVTIPVTGISGLRVGSLLTDALEVYADPSNGPILMYGNTTANGFRIGSQTSLGAGGGFVERFAISATGIVTIPNILNVGTGNTTEATAQLTVQAAGYGGYHWADGTAYYMGQNSAARSLRIYSSSYTAGVNLAAGGTSWGTFSDERLKYDIEPITDGLNKLNGIRCVSYRLIDVDASDSQKKLGVIAQDLVGVVDEVIDATKRNGDETDYMSVRYTELIPVLIKAIQELAADFQSYKSSHP